MTRSLPSLLILSRPTNARDPLFALSGAGPAMARSVRGVSDLVAGVAVSVPADTGGAWIAAIEALGLPVLAGPGSRPIERVEAFLEGDGGGEIVVATSYSHLLSAPALAEAVAAVREGGCDYAYDDTCELGFFLVMNRQCMADLGALPHNQIFSWPALLAPARKGLDLGRRDPESDAVRFLLGTGAFKSGLLPMEVDAAEFDGRSDRVAGFLRERLAARIGAETMDRLQSVLAAFSRDDIFKQILPQITFLRTILPHVPASAGRFLEIGYGRFPILSALFTNVFEEGTANELLPPDPEGAARSMELLGVLSRALGAYQGVSLANTASAERTMARLRLHSERLEDMGEDRGTFDFCFSKVVFEHVDNLGELSRSLFDVLRPGGVMAHWIDFNDSTTRLDFAHLEHSRDEARRLELSTNNVLLKDVVDCWTETGFVVEVAEKRVVKRPGLRIHPDWAGYDEDDLFCHAALVKAVKP